jgi:hypothetical protein
MKSVAFLVLAVLLGLAHSISIHSAVTEYALLSADQETENVTSTATGVGIFSYNSVTQLLQFQIIHNVVNPTAAHIHGPALPGTDAGVLYAIGASNGASPIVGNVTLTGTQESDLYDGELYINVHSTIYPVSGEIRGQVLNDGQSTSQLKPQYEVTGGAPVVSSAFGHAFLEWDDVIEELSYNVTHNVVNATAAHIHGPANFTSQSGVLLTLASDAEEALSPIEDEDVDFPAGTGEANYLQGLVYLNVHSLLWPNGEIRGNIPFANAIGAVTLDPTQDGVTSANIGAGVVALSADNTTLSIFVQSTIANNLITAMHLHGPSLAGGQAGVIYTLTTGQSSGTYFITTDTAHAQLILTGQTYLNVHTTAFPNGEIRGQVVPFGDLATFVATTGVPVATTASVTTGAAASASTVVVSTLLFGLVALFL